MRRADRRRGVGGQLGTKPRSPAPGRGRGSGRRQLSGRRVAERHGTPTSYTRLFMARRGRRPVVGVLPRLRDRSRHARAAGRRPVKVRRKPRPSTPRRTEPAAGCGRRREAITRSSGRGGRRASAWFPWGRRSRRKRQRSAPRAPLRDARPARAGRRSGAGRRTPAEEGEIQSEEVVRRGGARGL